MQPPTPKRDVAAYVLTIVTLSLVLWHLFSVQSAAVAQERLPETRLEIAGVDTSQFPTLGLNLIVTDRQSRPQRQLQALRVRENGAPIADYEIVPVTVGTDLYLIIDANSRIQEADDEGGLTRLQKVKDSILTYAGRFMDLAGRDHVTVIVPGDDGAHFLAEDVTTPAALIDAVRPYDAGRLPQSNPVDLLTLALERAAASKEAGRFAAIVLYTDASGLNESRFALLVEQAQASQTPIFTLLLGGGATPAESAVETATALTTPTRGSFVHMPAAADSSEIFQVIADNGVQSQVRYHSNITGSGEHSVSVTLENQRDEVTLDLELAPPEVRLQPGETTIRRAGTQPDTPLEELQPAVQPVVVQVTWPDGLPRQLQGASLLANGQAQEAPFVGGPGAGGGQFLQFDWRIADLDAGSYELTALVTDTLGLVTQSAPQTVVIELARPEPAPSPSPTETAEPMQALRELLPPLPSRMETPPYLIPAGATLALLLLAALAFRRRQYGQDREKLPAPESDGAEEAAALESREAGEAAYLESMAEGGARYTLPGANVTIGRDESQVRLRLNDRSVSDLHARIRWRDGNYWLYDEGSQHGTFLNHERLGLAPKVLKPGDEIQFGSCRVRFRIEKKVDAKPVHVGREEGESV